MRSYGIDSQLSSIILQPKIGDLSVPPEVLKIILTERKRDFKGEQSTSVSTEWYTQKWKRNCTQTHARFDAFTQDSMHTYTHAPKYLNANSCPKYWWASWSVHEQEKVILKGRNAIRSFVCLQMVLIFSATNRNSSDFVICSHGVAEGRDRCVDPKHKYDARWCGDKGKITSWKNGERYHSKNYKVFPSPHICHRGLSELRRKRRLKSLLKIHKIAIADTIAMDMNGAEKMIKTNNVSDHFRKIPFLERDVLSREGSADWDHQHTQIASSYCTAHLFQLEMEFVNTSCGESSE